jgi:ubiquinone/menaquinone biosynthesis C-methylase UbiE
MANVFDEMGIYWAEIAERNQTDRQIQFLKTNLKSKGYVLDLACGTGRHSIALTEEGYRMVGLDMSRKLLKIAKQLSKSVETVLGDMRFLPFKTGIFTAAMSMDTSFGYLPSEVDDRVSLGEVRRVLTQKGSFVIDVFNREELALKNRDRNIFSKRKEYPSFVLEQNRTLSDLGDLLCDSWTIHNKANGKVKFFEHKVHLYKLQELQRLLEDTGFGINRILGGYEGENFSYDSPRLIFLTVAV